MAVKAAVVGYEELTKPFEEVSDGNEEETKVDVEKVEEEEEIEDRELDELEKKDLEGLLMADVDGEVDEAGDEEDDVGLRRYSFSLVQARVDGSVYRIEEYIPDSLYEQYENLRDLALDWFIRLGVIGKGDKTSHKATSDSPRKSSVT
jgi:protein kinase C substrate 80K-H